MTAKKIRDSCNHTASYTVFIIDFILELLSVI
uniref:Uncharacterized protein n=1 Tax=Arundo donax TaxID=35708 RepID=A0A0A8YG57_ARUDO